MKGFISHKLFLFGMFMIVMMQVFGIAQAVPYYINYQGILTDPDGNLINDTVDIVFRIYDSESSPTPVWTETHTGVGVEDGLVNALLGTITAFPGNLFSTDNRWLGVQVNDNSEMTPRQRIVSVGYAMQSESADFAAYADEASWASYADLAPDVDWQVSSNNVYRSSGNVGIGTSSPTVDLNLYRSSESADVQVESDNGNATLTLDGTSQMVVGLYNQGALKGRLGYNLVSDYLYLDQDGFVIVKDGKVGIGAGATNPAAALHVDGNIIVDQKIQAEDSGGLELATDDSVTRMAVTDAGNVGIGTTSPGFDIHLYRSSESSDVKFESDNGNATLTLDGSFQDVVDFNVNGVNKGKLAYNPTEDLMFLSHNGNLVLKNGEVGIGTTAPEEALHVNGNIIVNQKLQADDSGGIEFATDEGTTRMSLIDSGNVGIGTTTPSDLLHVRKTSGNLIPRFEAAAGDVDVVLNASSGVPSVEFQNAGVYGGAFGYSITNDYLFLYHNANLIYKDGKLGIGTTTPTAGVDIANATGLKVGTNGVKITELRELTGTTDPDVNYTVVALPSGYTITNTRVISLEINNLTDYWAGIGMYDISYALRAVTVDEIYFSYSSSILRDQPFRIMIMKVE